MRKYRVDYSLSTKDTPESETIEADKIHPSWNGAVEFQVEDSTDRACDYGEFYRTIAVRQNCNVTEMKE